jgi:hypothetical protein
MDEWGIGQYPILQTIFMMKKLIQNSVMMILQRPMELILLNYQPDGVSPRAPWRIPNLLKDKDILKMNRYLKHMQARVGKGDVRVACLVIQHSKSLQLLAFHRADGR